MRTLPERIILCVDLVEEEAEPGKFAATLEVIKQTIINFVHVKLATCPLHSFALCSLTDTAMWLQDFTSDPNQLANALTNFYPQGPIPKCQLGSLFDVITAHSCLPALGPDPPAAITRAVLFYNRSEVIPELSESSSASWSMLSRRPDFVLDILFVHARAAIAPLSQEVFTWLTSSLANKSLDENRNEAGLPQFHFFLEVVKTNERRFYEKFAQLLAHSGQRADQFNFATTLEAE